MKKLLVVVLSIIMLVGCSPSRKAKILQEKLIKEVNEVIKEVEGMDGFIATHVMLVNTSTNKYEGRISINDTLGNPYDQDIKVTYDGNTLLWDFQPCRELETRIIENKMCTALKMKYFKYIKKRELIIVKVELTYGGDVDFPYYGVVAYHMKEKSGKYKFKTHKIKVLNAEDGLRWEMVFFPFDWM